MEKWRQQRGMEDRKCVRDDWVSHEVIGISEVAMVGNPKTTFRTVKG